MPARRSSVPALLSDRLYDPWHLCRLLRGRTAGSLLESARTHERSGRWSIIGAGEPELFAVRAGRASWLGKPLAGRPLDLLRRLLRARRRSPAPEPRPPFTGGAIGYIGYEAAPLFEPTLPYKTAGDTGLPDLCWAFYDTGAVVDHLAGRTLFFAPSRQAAERLRSRVRGLSVKTAARRSDAQRPRRPRAIAECSASDFMAMVEAARYSIARGDIFQANLSQRILITDPPDPDVVYERLRRINPSSFFGYLRTPSWAIVSGSPERLVSVRERSIETRPIAGTRRRGRGRREDQRKERDLLLSAKERAEHVMLVDLERNDLGRVCEYGSVTVDELMSIEDYSHVKHIVSNVRGTLKEGAGPVDVLGAVFPGGTITGAPKISCMRIIDRLETVRRGPYTGSLGYLGDDGDMDLNILIRGVYYGRGQAHVHAGAGIVAESDPGKELNETLHKAQAVLAALLGERRAASWVDKHGAGSGVY
ncbi:MAG: Aminodeoxychorismate synthase component 1 [Candidatus Omnitrophica bacterium]|nr:Aminodeoxychorismate synthase component 1 [Candidatus Omnitrophota bacterium]